MAPSTLCVCNLLSSNPFTSQKKDFETVKQTVVNFCDVYIALLLGVLPAKEPSKTRWQLLRTPQ